MIHKLISGIHEILKSQFIRNRFAKLYNQKFKRHQR